MVEKIRLRPLQTSDWAAFSEMRRDPVYRRTTGLAPCTDTAILQAEFAHLQARPETWAITRANIFVGFLQFSPWLGPDGLPDETSRNLDYLIIHSQWGKGYATAAVAQAIEKALSQFYLQALWAGVAGNNPASVKIMRHFSFQEQYTVSETPFSQISAPITYYQLKIN
ncbi:GNAT family N-acetyltransferase [Lactobacillus selangorensis]|nr:GNAT family N-acetyltransferase [Lactobacillus selangorensis]